MGTSASSSCLSSEVRRVFRFVRSVCSRRRLVGASTCGRNENGTFAVICVLAVYRVSIPQGGRRGCESRIGALSVWCLRAGGVVTRGQTITFVVRGRGCSCAGIKYLLHCSSGDSHWRGQTTPRLRVFASGTHPVLSFLETKTKNPVPTWSVRKMEYHDTFQQIVGHTYMLTLLVRYDTHSYSSLYIAHMAQSNNCEPNLYICVCAACAATVVGLSQIYLHAV